MSSEHAAPRSGRALGEMARYVLGILLGVVVLIVLFGKRSELLAAWHQLSQVSPTWVGAAICAEALSLFTFAFLQQRVLRLAGARVPLPFLYQLAIANDAIALTVPGEPAVSSAYRYRHYRRQGASGAGAAWTIFTILVAQAIGMSLILLVGVLIALAASTSTSSAGAALVGLVIVIAAGVVLARRDLVLRLASGLTTVARRLTGHPRGNLAARIEATLARMREIPLSAWATARVVTLATAVWACDFVCLVCSFRAVHAAIPWHGVLLAYGAAVVVGSFPIVPGGLGIVEGSLAVVLVAYGASRLTALSAAITFRLVNFWLAIAVGWICVGVIALQTRRAGAGSADTAVPAPE
jgi:putative heme transporter